MKLKRYAVSVMDNWTPLRAFLTLSGAMTFHAKCAAYSNIYKWDGRRWTLFTEARAWRFAIGRGIVAAPKEGIK